MFLLVIGGLNSKNSKELAKTCANFCANVYHIQSPDDIQITWLDNAKKTMNYCRRINSG
jgi:4-hydroxy-3-methylbut-2-enyl diphosphate reductase IspH